MVLVWCLIHQDILLGPYQITMSTMNNPNFPDYVSNTRIRPVLKFRGILVDFRRVPEIIITASNIETVSDEIQSRPEDLSGQIYISAI